MNNNKYKEFNRHFKDELFKEVYKRLTNHRIWCDRNGFNFQNIESDPTQINQLKHNNENTNDPNCNHTDQ